MSRTVHKVVNTVACSAALVMAASGELRPAGVRTAFELLAEGVKVRIVSMQQTGEGA